MKVEILDEAQEDLLDGYRFYECQSEGLGAYFLDSLFSDIDFLQIYRHPLSPFRLVPASLQTIPLRHLLSRGPQDRSSICRS